MSNALVHWKTTLAGAALAAVESIHALANWHDLSPAQLAFRFGVAFLTALLGFLAKDFSA